MDRKQYEQFVEDCWLNHNDDVRMQMAICTLGITGEAGEIAEKVKKYLRGDGPLDVNLFIKELGDELFYITKAARLVGHSLDDVMQANVEKLADRRARDKLRGEGDDR